jgi:hypothetical protein
MQDLEALINKNDIFLNLTAADLPICLDGLKVLGTQDVMQPR